jgi:predicted enzyme related to lactoylglutathione lyase
MHDGIKYSHTNIIAKDWRALAQFYISVFKCEPVPPERDLSGEWVDQLTNVPSARIRGIHLRFPGYSDGPTLEIFSYEEGPEQQGSPKINNPGFGHIAFHVSNVEATIQNVLAHGGAKYGERIEHEVKGVGILTAAYVRDPEGNIVEIQKWRRG